MSIDCELAIALWRRFGYLEKRVTYLEDKNRRLEFTIENLVKKFEILGKENLEILQFDPVNKDTKFSIGTETNDDQGQKSIQDIDDGNGEEMPVLEKMSPICVPKRIEESKNLKIRSEKVIRKKLRHKSKRLTKSKCKICHKVLGNTSLKRHQILHTGKKPYSCNICFKRFPRKDYLTRHIIVHNNSAKFQCQICWKPFQEQSKLAKHHSKIHKTSLQDDQNSEIFIMDGQVYNMPKYNEIKQLKIPEFICKSNIKQEISEIDPEIEKLDIKPII